MCYRKWFRLSGVGGGLVERCRPPRWSADGRDGGRPAGPSPWDAAVRQPTSTSVLRSHLRPRRRRRRRVNDASTLLTPASRQRVLRWTMPVADAARRGRPDPSAAVVASAGVVRAAARSSPRRLGVGGVPAIRSPADDATVCVHVAPTADRSSDFSVNKLTPPVKFTKTCWSAWLLRCQPRSRCSHFCDPVWGGVELGSRGCLWFSIKGIVYVCIHFWKTEPLLHLPIFPTNLNQYFVALY